jgi:hypothetical protein
VAGPAPLTTTGRVRRGRRLDRLLDAVGPWPLLAGLSAVVLLAHLPGTHATAWHFFDDAARLLLGRAELGVDGGSGLHLYRGRPDLQFGPLSAIVAVPLVLLGSDAGRVAAMVLGSALGLVAVALAADTANRVWPAVSAVDRRRTLLLGGAIAVVTWGDVAVRTAHLDDALALTAAAGALAATARRRPGWAALAAGVAVAAKPWAVVVVPLVLVALPPGSGPRAARRTGAVLAGRLALAAAVPLLTWGPFVLAEPATLDTAGFAIANDPTSVLRALGVDEATTPGWARPAQLLGGAAIATVVVAIGRWPAVLLAGVAWRLLLEPGANRYYTAGVVLGGLVLALGPRAGRLPWALLAGAVALEVTAMPGAPAGPGRWLRLATVVGALAVALRSSDPDPRPADRSGLVVPGRWSAPRTRPPPVR